MSHDIATFPIHLGLGSKANAEPAFDGVEWYDDYINRHAADGAEGRLVSQFTFDAPWQSWEMHPEGDEVVLCLEGEMTLIQELPDGGVQPVPLKKGQYAINPKGVWHTADTSTETTALFIGAAAGTIHRPR